MSRGLVILGSTGTIGANTLAIVDKYPERFSIVGLSAHSGMERLAQQINKYHPYAVTVGSNSALKKLNQLIDLKDSTMKVFVGESGLEELVTLPDVEIVMAGIVGAAGLKSGLAAVKAGHQLLLANKEPLVMTGSLFIEEARKSGAILLPIDSEHNAVYQCLTGNTKQTLAPYESILHRGVKKILLTGSGGPFRDLTLAQMEAVTPEQAIKHPNWVMGAKISVDSASMMNKGLELIEACHLFSINENQIEIIVHRQSIIHSMVEFVDGSVLAQMASPDMRIPIAHAMAWPERFESGAGTLDLLEVGRLDFEKPDYQRFPCLGLAREVAKMGGTSPTIMNAANEVAVAAFLEHRVGFTRIPGLIDEALNKIESSTDVSLQSILDVDRRTRKQVTEWVARDTNHHKVIGMGLS